MTISHLLESGYGATAAAVVAVTLGEKVSILGTEGRARQRPARTWPSLRRSRYGAREAVVVAAPIGNGCGTLGKTASQAQEAELAATRARTWNVPPS